MALAASAGLYVLSTTLSFTAVARGKGSTMPGRAEAPSPVDAENMPSDAESPTKESSDTKRTAGWGFLRDAFRPSFAWKGGGTGQGNETHGVSCDRAFDMADCLEMGTARESTTDFTTPLRRSSKLARFRVIRAADKLSARLFSEFGDFIMFAQVNLPLRRVNFHTYPPTGEGSKLFDPNSPAFSLHWDTSGKAWRFLHERCEHCQFAPPHLSCARFGKQQLAYIEHSKIPIGDGMFNCMTVRIPGVYSDGSCLVWCPMLGRGDLAAVPEQDASHETQLLVTNKPAWNDEVESLVLDFRGREVMASAKNFQTSLLQKPNHIICQFGKLGSTTFALDFRFPLSAAQAFAMAMTTIFWT